MTRYIRFLDEISAKDLPLVGGKGANLGEMTRAGLPVPPGFCLTAEAYRDFIASAGLQAPIANILASSDKGDPSDRALERSSVDLERPAAKVRQLIASQPMPLEIVDQVLTAYRQLAHRLGPRDDSSWPRSATEWALPVAVRSSATAEDLPTASFAGQQDTYLHVRGEAELLERIAACWASLWTARALAYRVHQGFDHQQVHLAVVVQAMIDAELAGILFTANPVTGNRAEIVINASYGLGEAIVSGQVTPDTLTVRKAGGIVVNRQIATKERMIVPCPAGGTETVTIPTAQQTAEALADQQIAGLVTLGHQIENHYQTPQDIEWAYACGRFYLLQARPITTLVTEQITGEFSRTMFVEIFPNALTPCFASAIQPMFQDMLRFTFEILGFTPPTDMESVALINGQPYFSRAYIAATLRPLSPPVRERLVSQFISPFGRHEQEMRGELSRAYVGMVEELRARLISGVTGNVTMETNKRLWDLAQVAKASPVVSDLLRSQDWSRYGGLLDQRPVEVLETLAQEPAAQDFVAALEAFLTAYGHREIRMDVRYPTWGEDPTPVLAFVRSYLDAGETQSPHRQQERLVQERQALTEEVRVRMRGSLKGRVLLPLFDWVLHQTQTHTRERDTIHFELTRLFPPMRAMLGELSRRWLHAGVINQPDDIFFLTLEQMIALASASKPMQAVVRTNRADFEASQTRGWPDIIRDGQEIWQSEGESVAVGASVEGQWQGIAGSPHVVTGVARIVRGPEEFHCLGKGEVLVAPSTDPAWTPLFALASAVVTEVGGILSHGAIVAREYGIPAVMGVRGITDALCTGQLILVDGNRGRVQLVMTCDGR